jgi:hypothetical protein
MTTKTPEEPTPKDEGPRSFSRLLDQVHDGELAAELGEKTQDLISVLTQYSDRYQREGKGSLTLVLSFKALGNGSIVLAGEIKTKTPTMPKAPSVFWRTPGNNLTLDNPRQQKLALREVPAAATKTKDISTEDRPVRTV